MNRDTKLLYNDTIIDSKCVKRLITNDIEFSSK